MALTSPSPPRLRSPPRAWCSLSFHFPSAPQLPSRHLPPGSLGMCQSLGGWQSRGAELPVCMGRNSLCICYLTWGGERSRPDTRSKSPSCQQNLSFLFFHEKEKDGILIIARSPLMMSAGLGGARLRGGALAWRMLSGFCLSVLLVERVPGMEETPTDSVEN